MWLIKGVKVIKKGMGYSSLLIKKKTFENWLKAYHVCVRKMRVQPKDIQEQINWKITSIIFQKKSYEILICDHSYN